MKNATFKVDVICISLSTSKIEHLIHRSHLHLLFRFKVFSGYWSKPLQMWIVFTSSSLIFMIQIMFFFIIVLFPSCLPLLRIFSLSIKKILLGEYPCSPMLASVLCLVFLFVFYQERLLNFIRYLSVACKMIILFSIYMIIYIINFLILNNSWYFIF